MPREEILKIIKVDNCGVCPYFKWGGSFLSGRLKDDWCLHSKQLIPNLKRHTYEIQKRYDIPNWCKLEDLSLNILLDMDLSDKHNEDDCDICKCPHL